MMKTLVFGAAVALGGMIVAGCVPALPTARLDPGGVTFDFQKASDTRFCIPRADTPGNIVDRAPWEDGICDVHHGKVKTADPVRRKVRDGMRWHQEEGVCRVEKLAALDAIAGKVDGKPLAPNVSGAFSKRVMLPDAKGGAWRISFYCQARHNLDGGLNYYLVYFKRRDPQTGRWVAVNSAAGREYVAYPFPDGWGRWNAFSHGVEIPAGCEAFELIMRTDGIGEMTFKDVGFFRAATETDPVSLVVSPHGLMGGDFALSCGQPGALGYSIRKNTDDRIDVRKCLFRLTLPKGVEYLGSSFAENATVKRTSRTDGGLDVTFAPRPALEFGKSFGSRNHMLALLRTNRPAGPLGQAILVFLSPEGTPLAKPAAIDLVAMDAIAPTRKPEHYANGVYPRGDTLSFCDESLSRLYADFMKTCGVDWIITASDSDLDYANWRAAGFRHVTRQFNWTNGYGAQFWQGRPEDEKFVVDPTAGARHGSTWDSYIARGLCPFSVLNDKPFFLTNTLPREIDAPLHGADGLWANWEPFMFTGRGCNCATCQSEYAKWRSKTGGSVGDFRSEVHGRMVKKIDRLARRRTPEAGATGFIPGVSWREMASSWRENDPSPESRPIDYAGDLAWINAWGPYVVWQMSSTLPYQYAKRHPLMHFVAAKDVREQTDRDFQAGKRPRLMSFPQGLQGHDWVTQPEHMEMALDSFFFNRWEASVLYFFPQGYDARYWRAFARATARAAKCEAFVRDGMLATDACVLVPVAEYAAPCTQVSTYLPKYMNVSTLQHVAYDIGAARLVAALNFWDKGGAFFTLRAKGLGRGDYRVIDEDGVLYAKSRLSDAWTADELAGGIRLMVGAARTKAYFIVPEEGASVGVPTPTARFLPEDVASLYKTHQATLRAAADEDARVEKGGVVTTDRKAEI